MSSCSEYEIDHLIDISYNKKDGWSFKVSWKGFNEDQDSWIRLIDISIEGLREKVEDLYVSKKTKRSLINQFLQSIEFQEVLESTRGTTENDLKPHPTSMDTYSDKFELSPTNHIQNFRLNNRGNKLSENIFKKSESKLKPNDIYKYVETTHNVRTATKQASQGTVCTIKNLNHYQSEEFNFMMSYAKKLLVTRDKSVKVNPDSLKVEVNTIIDRNTYIQGLQKLWVKDSHKCYRVSYINYGHKFVRTVDSIYLEHPKHAYDHLKKKLSHLWLINQYCQGLIEKTTAL